MQVWAVRAAESAETRGIARFAVFCMDCMTGLIRCMRYAACNLHANRIYCHRDEWDICKTVFHMDPVVRSVRLRCRDAVRANARAGRNAGRAFSGGGVCDGKTAHAGADGDPHAGADRGPDAHADAFAHALAHARSTLYDGLGQRYAVDDLASAHESGLYRAVLSSFDLQQ